MTFFICKNIFSQTKILVRSRAMFFMFANLFTVWLNRSHQVLILAIVLNLWQLVVSFEVSEENPASHLFR
jgi:hypothetical protein